MARYLYVMLLSIFMPLNVKTQQLQRLELPRQEMLSSQHVLQVIQDSEGFLWYATEGGGLCRDDGRQIIVFRSDAEHPNLLGSNDVACLAESGIHLIIGTFHGAYVLDKAGYTIRQLTEVDDKRVDDIIVTSDGHWWLTANKMIYEYSSKGTLQHIYTAGNKYISRLHEDAKGRLWASEWNGGLLCLKEGHFLPAPWPIDAAPTAFADAQANSLWIGTAGKGIVRYNLDKGTIEGQKQTGQIICLDLQLSTDCKSLWACTPDGLVQFQINQELTPSLNNIPTNNNIYTSRLSLDLQGNLLVANNNEPPFAVMTKPQQRWELKPRLSDLTADSIRIAHNLSTRPTALAFDEKGKLWFSTGKDIRCKTNQHALETVVLNETKDVSAMTFTIDSTLWLGTIFGTLYAYKNGGLTTDEYASNKQSDAIISLTTDSVGNLIIEYDRYIRYYNTTKRTLQQRAVEKEGVYEVELQQTTQNEYWSQPITERSIVERLPHWLTTWWMLCIYILSLSGLSLLLIHYYILRRQRHEFLKQMQVFTNQHQPGTPQEETAQIQKTEPKHDEWLQMAIAQVEAHLSDDTYNVEQLSSDLCMSRMTFYRKLQSATGQKPTEFIRTIRLRHAAQLLREGKLSITEISYATGFSSVSYFSRSFRTMFGVPPTQFTCECGNVTTTEVLSPSEMPN